MKAASDKAHGAVRPLRRSVAGFEITLLPAAGYDVGFLAQKDSLGFAFDAQAGFHAIGSDRSEPFSRLPNTLALTPRGCDVRSSSAMGGEYLLITGKGVRALPGSYCTNVQHPGAFPMAAAIRKWLLGGILPDVLEAEARIGRLCAAAPGTSRLDKAARWMTPQRFRRIADLIEDRLDAPITVALLAGEIRVSPSFLSRAFSAFCGQSPYDYVLSRRLQRARRLISATTRPLPEIAIECGFSSQSHLSAAMKARLGLSPSGIVRP
ncbi:helix-turn-helix transcriptional regulator [Roseibium sp.]|uniref:helix-turn-helix transcriptional regulator n=1 Tax=Roseibium sp. TaxID=1936156 RepID=UPI003D13CA4D